jgi:hypothetical protein
MADIELEVQVRRMTAGALLVATEACKEPAWVPRSQISDWSPNGDLEDATSIFIPQWLAEEKGLV